MSAPLVMRVLVALAMLVTSPAVYAATDSELADIRAEIRAMKEQYEARIRALEERLRSAESAARIVERPAVDHAGAGGAGPSTAGPVAPLPSAGVAAFNPAISLVLQGTYANLSRDPQRYALYGLATSSEVSPGRRGFSLGESELTLSANVDDRLAGNLTLALTSDHAISVEEAYGILPSLKSGVVPKFGRFFSGVGYLNEQHQHTWDFYDAPLAYQAFLGEKLIQDGVQVKWVAPLDHFLELGAEIGNGDAFPGSFRNRNGAGAASIFAHTGGDIGASQTWRAGLSYLETRARSREARQPDAAGGLADIAFSGKSRVAIADFVWKYAPHGNARERSFKLQGEYLWRRETGEVLYDPYGLASAGAHGSRQSGWYLQGVYQFRPAWRVGLRYDRLHPGRADYGANADLLDYGTFQPDRGTAMLDYSPSEFTRWRLQYARSRTRPDVTDHQLYLQYVLTLGAHGAHRY